MTMVRRYPVEKRIRAVGRTREASYELASEVVECIPWLRRRLLSWFERNGRSFPWRDPGRTPYEVVVAEILLQRTTAAGVYRALPVVGNARASAPQWPREHTQAPRALAAEGAGLSIPGSVRRRARWRHSSHAGRTGSPGRLEAAARGPLHAF